MAINPLAALEAAKRRQRSLSPNSPLYKFGRKNIKKSKQELEDQGIVPFTTAEKSFARRDAKDIQDTSERQRRARLALEKKASQGRSVYQEDVDALENRYSGLDKFRQQSELRAGGFQPTQQFGTSAGEEFLSYQGNAPTQGGFYGGTTQSIDPATGTYRAAPTVPTTENPLISSGSAPTTPTAGGDDQQTLMDIAFKRAKGEDLTDEELKFLIAQQFKPAQGPDVSGVQGVIGDQITGLQGQLSQEREAQAKERAKLVGEQDALAQQQASKQQGIIQQGADMQIQAGQSTYSFKGWGRSTSAATNAALIQQNAIQDKLAVQQAADLQTQLFQKELQGADEEALQPLKDQIAQLQTESRKLTIESAMAAAEANASAGVNFFDALENIAQVLPSSQQNKINKDASELLGYVADEFGNPAITDQDGNPIPVSGEDTVKYSTYVDPYTQQTFFYDPFNPMNTFPAAGNTLQQYQTAEGVSSSPTTYTGGMADASQLAAQQFGEEVLKYGGNCYLFAKSIIPNIPAGASNKNQRAIAITNAENAGYGGKNMDFVQVGDAIHTTEGDVGHTAIVIGREGDNLILLESNYKSGQITSGRRINKNDPSVLGWIRNTGEKTGSDPLDGNSFGIFEATQGISFTPAQETEFRAALNGKKPEFRGSPAQKDNAEAEFEKEFNYWASLPENQGIVETAGKDQLQVKSVSFAGKMEDSAETMRSIEGYLEGLGPVAFHTQERLPNFLKSEPFQRFEQAKSAFISALLRQESGATITDQEFNRYEKEYFPRPGDSKAVIEQKRKAREAAIEQMYGQAGLSGSSSVDNSNPLGL